MASSVAASDWITHQHRDTLASIVGHPPLTSYLALADGVSLGRVRFEMTEVRAHSLLCTCADGRRCSCVQRMLQPCGPPPKKDED